MKGFYILNKAPGFYICPVGEIKRLVDCLLDGGNGKYYCSIKSWCEICPFQNLKTDKLYSGGKYGTL